MLEEEESGKLYIKGSITCLEGEDMVTDFMLFCLGK